MLYLLVTLIGLFIGSFLNVCICRIPKKESVIYPPSHCTRCRARIKPYDLIPVLSYMMLKGRCRHCGEKISIKYPAVELMTGILFLFSFLKYGLSIGFIKYIVLISILIVVSFIDLEYSIIPLSTMVFAAAAGIVLNIVGYGFNTSLLTFFYGLLAGGGVILIIAAVTGGMGGGDIQLMAVTGLFLGFELTVLNLLLSFIIGAAAGIILIVLKKKTRKDYMPFGPWISLATVVIIFAGEAIIKWYAALLAF